jgi:N-terminal acetyltransferase B complex catalytic subunit
LYNAHMLKRHGRPPIGDTRHLALIPKHRWTQADSNTRVPFRPSARWTAWPMRPNHVPRRRETWGTPAMWYEYDEDENSQGTYLRHESWLPSRDLQEELEAIILQRAHKNLQQHKMNSETNIRPGKSSLAGTSRFQPSDASQNPASPKIDSEREEPSSLSDGTITDAERKSTRARSSSSSSKLSSQSESSRSPSMLLDDEIASSALKAPVRECMGKLNFLLDALHKSRKGGRKGSSLSRNGSVDLRQPKSRRRESVKHGASSLDVESKATASASPPSTSAATSSNLRERACRDWSEILSLAVTIGWDEAAVDRTVQRCATLFGETMELRSVAGHMAPHIQSRPFIYRPDARAQIMTERTPVASISNTPSTYACSYSHCERHRKPFLQRWELRQHLRRSHKLRDADIGTLMSSINNDRHCKWRRVTSIEPEHDASEDDILRPITICMPNSRQ